MAKEEIPVSQASRLINPGPVVLVTAQLKGKPNIMPAAWVTPISFDPPLVGLCVSPLRYTHEMIYKTEEFALNIPTVELLKQVVYCGDVSGRDVDKFKETGLRPADPRVIQAPLIEECIGHIECGVVNAYPLGDHTLFVGEVQAVQVDKEAFDERWLLKVREAKPLHHLGGKFFAVLEEPIEASERK